MEIGLLPESRSVAPLHCQLGIGEGRQPEARRRREHLAGVLAACDVSGGLPGRGGEVQVGVTRLEVRLDHALVEQERADRFTVGRIDDCHILYCSLHCLAVIVLLSFLYSLHHCICWLDHTEFMGANGLVRDFPPSPYLNPTH